MSIVYCTLFFLNDVNDKMVRVSVAGSSIVCTVVPRLEALTTPTAQTGGRFAADLDAPGRHEVDRCQGTCSDD